MVFIYTDGGCSAHSDKSGAWAYVLVKDDENKEEVYGVEYNTTNSRVEVLALYHALVRATSIEPNTQVIIRSDSQYCVNAYNYWVENWNNNGWKKSNGKDVMHSDLWVEINKLRQSNIKVEWVKGHSGDKWNEYVDNLTHNRE